MLKLDSKIRLKHIPFMIALGLGSLTGLAAQASTPACSELFESSHPTQSNGRIGQFEATIHANRTFPQVNPGIDLTIVSYYFLHPSPIQDILRPANEDEIRKTAETMNRSHRAFGVRFATPGFATPYPVKTVLLERVAAVLNNEKRVAYDGIVRAINILIPQKPIQIPKHENGTEYRRVPEYPRLFNEIDRWMAALPEAEALKLRRFGQSISEVLNSSDAKELSNQLRQTIKATEAAKHGESLPMPAKPVTVLQAIFRIQSLLLDRLALEFPDIPMSKWDSWYWNVFVMGEKDESVLPR